MTTPMTTHEKALEAGAAREAACDGRDFNALSKADKQRYTDRFADGVSAYISALTPPDVAGLVDDLAQEIRRVDGSNSLGSGALAEALAPFIASLLTHPSSENAHLREREGWKLVPVEPTRAMWAAMADTLYGYKNRHHDKVVGDLWSAMLAASPSHQDQSNG